MISATLYLRRPPIVIKKSSFILLFKLPFCSVLINPQPEGYGSCFHSFCHLELRSLVVKSIIDFCAKIQIQQSIPACA